MSHPTSPATSVTEAAQQPSAGPAFPRQAALTLVQRLPAYARLALALSLDARIPAPRRAALMGAAAYLLSPIDVVPGIIPLVGQLDDLLVIIVALRMALASLSPQERLEVLASAGLDEDDLGDDLATLGAVAGWLVDRGLRAGRAVARVGITGTVAVAKAGARMGRRAAGDLERRLRTR